MLNSDSQCLVFIVVDKVKGFNKMAKFLEREQLRVVVAPPNSRGVTLLLAKASKPEQHDFIGNQAGGRVFIFLNTDDFWRDYEHMKSIGINFVRDPQEQDYGTVAVFEDLYGNLWDLLQLNPDHPMAKR